VKLLHKVRAIGFGAVAALALLPATALATTVYTVDDAYGATWTLTVENSCTVCDTTLAVQFTNPTQFDGKYLQSIQFSVDGYTPVDPEGGYVGWGTGTSGADDLTKTDWTFVTGNLSNNPCNDKGKPNAACGDYKTTLGFPIVGDGLAYHWDFNLEFDPALGDTLDTGNIRAAFNNFDGKNFRILSPGSLSPCVVGSDECPEPSTVPEPASMLLFGIGALAVANRARRRATR